MEPRMSPVESLPPPMSDSCATTCWCGSAHAGARHSLWQARRAFLQLGGSAVAAAAVPVWAQVQVGEASRLRHLVLGAMVGATLFTLGKLLLAWYLSTAAVVSAYGAAGSLVVLLMWIYFSSAILLFSASCAQALEQDSARASAREPAV